MSDFIIEKNVPVPPRASRDTGITPFYTMEVGDCAFFKGPLTKKEANKLINVAGRVTKRKGIKFVRRVLPEGLRIWRVS